MRLKIFSCLPVRPSLLLLACLGLVGFVGLSGFSSQAIAAADPHLARNLAASCTGCHGGSQHSAESTDPTREGIAMLAGRQADQLLRQLIAFRRGERSATIMDQISRGYDEEQLRLIAEWFAAQPRK